MQWFIPVLFVILLVPVQASSEDFIKLGFTPEIYILKSAPTVCVHEPRTTEIGFTEKELYSITKAAVNKWVDALEKNSSVKDVWDIKVITKSAVGPELKNRDFLDCDINIEWAGAPNIGSDGAYIAATAGHQKDFMVRHNIKIYTWSYEKMVDIKYENGTTVPHFRAFDTPKYLLEYILVHELGHTFGLQHALWNEKEFRSYSFDREHAALSVMYFSPGSFVDFDRSIKKLDWTALIYKYGTDGWGGWTNIDLEYIKSVIPEFKTI